MRERLAAAGISSEPLLMQPGLCAKLLDDPENRYTLRQHVDLLTATAAALDDPSWA